MTTVQKITTFALANNDNF